MKQYVKIALILVVLAVTSYASPKFNGGVSFASSGSYVSYNIPQIYNNSTVYTTGSIRIEVYGTYLPYAGGYSYGTYLYQSALLSPLYGGYVYNNLTGTVVFNDAPFNYVYLLVLLEEYTASGWVLSDYQNILVSHYFSTYYTAPTIVSNPSAQTVVQGSKVIFSVTATGSATLSYQWYKNTLAISGATLSSYSINSTSQSDAGNYSVMVTNNAGSVNSSIATLTVSNPVVAPSIINQPASQSVNTGNTASFSVSASGTSPFAYQWYKNGIAISGATNTTYTIAAAASADLGNYTVTVTNSAGSITSNTANLSVNQVVLSPVITTQPVSQSVITGSAVLLSVGATGSSMSYQWYYNSVAIFGATSSTYIISSVQISNTGNYTVKVSNTAGSLFSNAVALNVLNDPGRLTNLSVLSLDGPGAQLLTVGFVTGGSGTTGSQNLLIRGIGPTIGLAPFNVANVLADPAITVFNSSTSIVATNDNWGSSVSNATAVMTADAATGAFALTSTTSLDAALCTNLNAGGYSVQVAGKNSASGNVIAEVYDNTPVNSYTTTIPRLVNLSCLEQVSSGGILSAGFVIGGSTAVQVLIRASGPTLGTAPFNVSGIIPDPKVTVFNSSSAVLATNAGWGGSASITAANKASGAFQFASGTSKDSAVLLTLQPGAYTVQAASASGTAGVTLIEVYEVPAN